MSTPGSNTDTIRLAIIDDDAFKEKLKSAQAIHKELEYTRNNLKQIYKLSALLTKTVDSYAQQLQDFATLLQGFTFSEESPTEPIVSHFGQIFQSFSKVNLDTVSEWNATFNFPLAQLLKDVLYHDQTNELRSRLIKTKEQYDIVQKKVNQIKSNITSPENYSKTGTISKGRDPTKQAEKEKKQQQEVEAASAELSKDLDDCIETLKTVQAQTRVEFMQQMCACMATNVTHYQKAQSISAEIAAELSRQKEVTAEAKHHFETRRLQLKEKQISQLQLPTVNTQVNIPSPAQPQLSPHHSISTGSGSPSNANSSLSSSPGSTVPGNGNPAVNGASTTSTSPQPDEKQGHLYRLGRGRMWQMRVVLLTHDRLLQICRKGKDDTSGKDTFELIMCTVRRTVENVKFPYCFEVIHPRKRVTFRALNKEDYEDWIQAIQNSIAIAISGSGEVSEKRLSIIPETFTALAEMRREPSNLICADCRAPNPEWVSINTGAFICIECSGIHRSFGVHISAVRSLTMDALPRYLIQMLQKLPNTVVNTAYEERLPADYSRPTADTDRETRTKFLTEKYVQKSWVGVYQGSVEQKQLDLVDALLANDVPLVVKLFAQGAKYTTTSGEPLLHVVIDGGALPVMAEVLVTAGAPVNATDKDGKTALHAAVAKGSLEFVKLLVGHDAQLNVKDTSGCEPLFLVQSLREKAELLKDEEEEKFVEIEEYLTKKIAAHQALLNSGGIDYGSMSKYESSPGRVKSPKTKKKFLRGKLDAVTGKERPDPDQKKEDESVTPSSKFFTVYIPPADKKTYRLNDQTLRAVLEKLAKTREFSLSDFAPVDMFGRVVPLDTKLELMESDHVTLMPTDKAPKLDESFQDSTSPRQSDDSTPTDSGGPMLVRTQSGKWPSQQKSRSIGHLTPRIGNRITRTNTNESNDESCAGGFDRIGGSSGGQNMDSADADHLEDDDLLIHLVEGETADTDDGFMDEDGALSDIEDPYVSFLPPPLPPTPISTVSNGPTNSGQNSPSLSRSLTANAATSGTPSNRQVHTARTESSSAEQLSAFTSTSMPALPQLKVGSTPVPSNSPNSRHNSDDRLKLSLSTSDTYSPRLRGSRGYSTVSGTSVPPESRRSPLNHGSSQLPGRWAPAVISDRSSIDASDPGIDAPAENNQTETSRTATLTSTSNPGNRPANARLEHTVSATALRTGATNQTTVPQATRTKSAVSIRVSSDTS